MILDDKTVEVQSNFDFDESVDMNISAGAKAIIIGHLISQYSDPYLACLREYTSNADDSRREAGSDRATEVTFPTALSQNLVIRDYGTGLSREEMKGFGQFGDSTKRDSNDKIGAFGIGSKSGLAMASQFVVKSVQNGRMNTAVIGRKPNNEPYMGFLEEVDTDEPNGVTITIPTSESMRYYKAVDRDFFIGWKPGTIEIDGNKPPRSVHDDKQYVYHEGLGWVPVWSSNAKSSNSVRALVGPVLYTINMDNFYDTTGWSSYNENAFGGVILELPIGSVEIAPSREELIYDKKTRKAVQERLDKVLSAVSKQYEIRTENAETAKEAISIRNRAEALHMDVSKYTWKGRIMDVPRKTYGRFWDRSKTRTTVTMSRLNRSSWERRKVDNNEMSIDDISPWDDSAKFKHIIITDTPLDDSAKGNLRRAGTRHVSWFLKGYNDGEHAAITYLYFIEDKDKSQLNYWIQETADDFISYEKYLEIAGEARKKTAAEARATRKANAAAGKPKTLEIRMIDSSGHLGKVLDISDLDQTDKTFIYIQAGDNEFHSAFRRSLYMSSAEGQPLQETAKLFAGRYGDKSNVFLAINKSDKLANYVNAIPGLISLEDFIVARIQAIDVKAFTLTEDELDGIWMQETSNHHWVSQVKRELIDLVEDEKSKEWLKTAKSAKRPEGAPSWIKELNSAIKNSEIDTVKPIQDALTKIDFTKVIPTQGRSSRYPLLENFWRSENAEHTAWYINARDREFPESVDTAVTN